MTKLELYPKLVGIVRWIWDQYRDKESTTPISKQSLYFWAEENGLYKAAVWFLWNRRGKTIDNGAAGGNGYHDDIYIKLPSHFPQLDFLDFYTALMGIVRQPTWYDDWYIDFPETKISVQQRKPQKDKQPQQPTTTLVQDLMDKLREAGFVRYPVDFIDDVDLITRVTETVTAVVSEQLAGLKIALMPAIGEITELVADKEHKQPNIPELVQSVLVRLEQNTTQVGQLKGQIKQVKEVVTTSRMREILAEVEELRQENAAFRELLEPLRTILGSIKALIELWELFELHRPDLDVVKANVETLNIAVERITKSMRI